MYGKKRFLIWLIMITIVAMIPVLSADASSSEMTFEEFLKEVVDRKGNFDGGGGCYFVGSLTKRSGRLISYRAIMPSIRFSASLMISLSPISNLNIFPLISLSIRMRGPDPATGLKIRSVTRNFNFSTKEM